MMSFLHPEFLYYMLPPLFILFGLLLTQKEAQLHFFSQEVIERLRVSANTLTLRARNALFFLIGVLLVIALAQPVIDGGIVKVKAKSSDIMIALDISDSMLAQDVYPNRLKLAKQKALELLKSAPKERIGVIGFAKNSYLVAPLSFDHSAVSFLLSELSTDSITEKGTNFLSMLDVVNKTLSKNEKKYLLILSDGGDKDDFSQEIALAKENKIVVFVIGIGTTQGAPVKLENGSFIKQNGAILISKLNENIAKLATSTGGVYIQGTTSNDDIKAMLQEIESVSEKKELKSEDIHRYIPLFYYPVGLALLLLLIATSSMSKRKQVHLPSAFLLFALFFVHPDSQARVFDFMQLDEAKKAYEQQEYEKASKLYTQYAQETGNTQSFYNGANALYKLGKYKEAAELYNKAVFESEDMKAKKYSNLGNAYAKQGDVEMLKKAKEVYEKSLKIKEDKDTRENLAEVEKLLKQQEQKNQDSQDNKEQDKKNQDKKNQDKKEQDKQNKENKNKNQENKDQEQQQKDKNSKDQDSKDSQNSSKDKKEESQKHKDSSKKEDKEKNKNEKKEKKSPQDEKKSQNKEKNDLQELKNKDDKVGDDKSANASQQKAQEKQMSDAEEKKWLDELNKQHATYMYMLNDTKEQEDTTNEKPW